MAFTFSAVELALAVADGHRLCHHRVVVGILVVQLLLQRLRGHLLDHAVVVADVVVVWPYWLGFQLQIELQLGLWVVSSDLLEWMSTVVRYVDLGRLQLYYLLARAVVPAQDLELILVLWNCFDHALVRALRQLAAHPCGLLLAHRIALLDVLSLLLVMDGDQQL